MHSSRVYREQQRGQKVLLPAIPVARPPFLLLHLKAHRRRQARALLCAKNRRLGPASVRGQVILRHHSSGPVLLLHRTSIQCSASQPLAATGFPRARTLATAFWVEPQGQAARHLHASGPPWSPSFTGQEQTWWRTHPQGKTPPLLGGGDGATGRLPSSSRGPLLPDAAARAARGGGGGGVRAAVPAFPFRPAAAATAAAAAAGRRVSATMP